MAIMETILRCCLVASVVMLASRASPTGTTNDDTDEASGLTGMADGLVYADSDLRLTPKQYKDLRGKGTSRPSDEGYVPPIVLWPGGVVPYEISSTDFDAKGRYEILSAFSEIEKYTCITLRPKTATDKDYLALIEGPGGCSSELGLLKFGRQTIHLAKPICRDRGKYLHEILHTLGVIHEHQNWMRDDWIDIIKVNIRDGQLGQFDHYAQGSYERRGVEYSYHSIMHYSTKAFSFDNYEPTIKAKDPKNNKYMGQRKGLSYSDVELINKMYRCQLKKQCPNSNKCGSTGHLDQHCECICKDGSQDCDSTKTPTSTGGCVNTHELGWECYRFAAQGKCQSTASWMESKCAKACAVCGGGQRRTQNNVALTQAQCVDNYPECVRYSNPYYCRDDAWTKQNCRKTCGKCGGGITISVITSPPAGACVDKIQHCDVWINRLTCSNAHVTGSCKKSCNLCGGGADTTTSPGSCTDRHVKCSVLKDRGECVVSPLWMEAHCPATCGYCNGWKAVTPANSCANRNSNCKRWSYEGLCIIDGPMMSRDCRGACRLCNSK